MNIRPSFFDYNPIRLRFEIGLRDGRRKNWSFSEPEEDGYRKYLNSCQIIRLHSLVESQRDPWIPLPAPQLHVGNLVRHDVIIRTATTNL